MRKMVAIVALATAGFGGQAVAGASQQERAGARGQAPDAQASTARKCHPSYRGRCLKRNASDYDCKGGSGNGPYYTGRVRVVGPDVFRLDADGDGIGCE
jgi:hypothetical protein